jgi:hypothetical protein
MRSIAVNTVNRRRPVLPTAETQRARVKEHTTNGGHAHTREVLVAAIAARVLELSGLDNGRRVRIEPGRVSSDPREAQF